MRNPQEDIYKHPVGELNRLTREYLDREFMLGFIDDAKVALRFAIGEIRRAEKNAIDEIDRLLPVFRSEHPVEKECRAARQKHLLRRSRRQSTAWRYSRTAQPMLLGLTCTLRSTSISAV